LFGVVVGRESSSETKESGALTKIALDTLGANPDTTVMIGDAPMDYISAKNAGIENSILVATGQICAEDLKQTTKFVLNDLSELEIV
jgi:phosphoglycolate phosphatase-like HAD superfamily hydrolase